MAQFTGYLLGKVQLEGAIRSEVLASLVETLLQRYQPSDPNKKHFKFHENNKYTVECSERGLKLTAPGFRGKDEGFESDCESVRSVKMNETVNELDLSDLMNHLAITKEEKDTECGTMHVHSSLSSSGISMDNASISSSSGLHVSSDDSHSSSGNGSDSDEFSGSGERSPYWETLPNLSSFQSYPIEDVVFCHCDALHPSTLVWVVRHLAKMMALVTSFRTRSEAEDLFQIYRDLRLKLKPLKYKINPILGSKVHNIPPAPQSPAPSPPSSSASVESSSSSSSSSAFSSLPPVYPTEILHETQNKSPLFSYEPKSLDYEFDGPMFSDPPGSSVTQTTGSALLASSRSYMSPQLFANATIMMRHNDSVEDDDIERDEDEEDEVDSEEVDSEENSENIDEDLMGDVVKPPVPQRPQRKVYNSGTLSSTTSTITPSKSGTSSGGKAPAKPVLLVPLKTESVTAPRSSYPKESYMYHVMGRSSSTFAPYQRSLNFMPTQYSMHNSANGGGDYLAWGNGRHLLVPFSSWLEMSDMPKIPHAVTGSSRKLVQHTSKARFSPRGNSRPSVLSMASSSSSKGTSKILLRDSSGREHGMWATLSQRFKRNFRDTLMPKLNGMWSQHSDGRGPKKKPNKKVTFNAWATVQMV